MGSFFSLPGFSQRHPKQPCKPKNFELSKIILIKELNFHSDQVTSLCLTKDFRLASASLDGKIKIINLNTFEMELEIYGHDLGINYISLLENGNIASCSKDATIKIWEINKFTHNHIATLFGHYNSVTKVIQISNNRIASSSEDRTIRIWTSSSPFECIMTLEGHTRFVYSIIELKNGLYLVSGSNDFTLRIWNSLTGDSKEIIQKVICLSSNGLIETNSNRVLVGGRGTISVINSSTFQVETKIFSNVGGRIWGLFKYKESILICNEQDMLVQIIDKEYKKVAKKEDVHLRSTLQVIFTENNLITCSKDNFIKVWEF